MLIDIPYSKLKEYGRKYDVHICRDIHEIPFADIAKKHGVSNARVRQDYDKIMVLKLDYYVNHLSVAHGYGNTDYFTQIMMGATDCYGGRGRIFAGAKYTVAYLEKEYSDILRDYRAGEPGMPERFLRALPPLRIDFSEQTVSDIIKLRENEGLGYAVIGDKLRMTKEKARDLYDCHYHALFIYLSQKIMDATGEEDIRWKYLFAFKLGREKKRYDSLIKDYPAFA